jgi:hypothetical protein
MITAFITTQIDLSNSPSQLHQAIATALHKYGTPLRWAITAIDADQGKVYLEAVVTRESNYWPSAVVPITSV